MEGGVKTVKKTKKTNSFKMSDMNKALQALMGETSMDTDIKKTRKTMTQPTRAPSERIKKIVKPKIVVSAPAPKPKKTEKRKRPLPTLKEMSLSPPRHPVLYPFDDDTIVKRNSAVDFAYRYNGHYIEEFNDLFKKHIPELRSFIHNDAMDLGQPMTDDEVSDNIVQLTDDLYFAIRDKLIGNVRSRSF